MAAAARSVAVRESDDGTGAIIIAGVFDSESDSDPLQKRNGPCVDGDALTKAQFVVPTDVWYDDASDCVWVADRWWLRKLNLNTLVVSTEWESPNRERFSVDPFDDLRLYWTEWSDIEKLAAVPGTHPSSPHERQFWVANSLCVRRLLTAANNPPPPQSQPQPQPQPQRPTKRESPLETTESFTSDLAGEEVRAATAYHVAGYHVPGDTTDRSHAAFRARFESVRMSDCASNLPPAALPCDERFHRIRCVLSFPARVLRDSSQSNATAAAAAAAGDRDGCDGLDESILIASERALRWLYRKRQPLRAVAAAASGAAASASAASPSASAVASPSAAAASPSASAAASPSASAAASPSAAAASPSAPSAAAASPSAPSASGSAAATAPTPASVRCSGIVTDADPACESDRYHIETFQFRSLVAPLPAAAASAAATTDATAATATATEEWKFDPTALARHPFDSDRFYVAANSIIYGCSLPSTPQYAQSIASALHRTFESYSALYPLPHELTELVAQYLIRPVLTVDLTIHSPAAAPTRVPYAKLSSYVHNTQREHIYRTRQYHDVCALACVPAIAGGRDESGGVRLIVAAYDPIDAMYACDASRDSAATAPRFQVLTTSIGLRFHPDLYLYAAGCSDSLPVNHPLIDNPTPPAPRRRFVDGLTYDRRRHCVSTALYSRQIMKVPLDGIK